MPMAVLKPCETLKDGLDQQQKQFFLDFPSLLFNLIEYHKESLREPAAEHKQSNTRKIHVRTRLNVTK